jgi:hypothetical protein
LVDYGTGSASIPVQTYIQVAYMKVFFLRTRVDKGFAYPKVLLGILAVSFVVGFVGCHALINPNNSRPIIWTQEGTGKWLVKQDQEVVKVPDKGRDQTVTEDEVGISKTEVITKSFPQDDVVSATKPEPKLEQAKAKSAVKNDITANKSASAEMDAEPPVGQTVAKPKEQIVKEGIAKAKEPKAGKGIKPGSTTPAKTVTPKPAIVVPVYDSKPTQQVPPKRPEPLESQPPALPPVQVPIAPPTSASEVARKPLVSEVDSQAAIRPTNKNLRILGSEHFPRTDLPSGYSVKPLGQ